MTSNNKNKLPQVGKRNKGGRPRLYTDSAILEQDIEKYFLECENRTKPFVTKEGVVIEVKSPAPEHITGLCWFLGLDNNTLNNYQRMKDDAENGQFFSSVVTRAKKRCEMYAVNQLFEGNKGNKADFVLKNNFKWEDKTTTDFNLEGNIIKQIHEGRRRAGIIEGEIDEES